MSGSVDSGHTPQPSQKRSWFEDIVIVVAAVACLGGAVAIKLQGADVPPILIGILTGTGVAALVYRFLGGIPPGTSVTIGAFKLGGTLGALLAVSWMIDGRLVAEATGEQTIHGTLEDLQGEEALTSLTTSLFSRRVYGADGRFNYEWRIITPKRLADGEKISFYFDRGLKSAKSATKHELVVQGAFYSQPVRIQYQRATDKLFEAFGGRRELASVEEAAAVFLHDDAPHGFGVFPVVHAQAGTAPAQILARLESSDPIIRREARAALVRSGKAGLPAIKAALQEGKASYRVQLGAIAALNDIQGLNDGDVSGAPFKAALRALSDPDASLAGEAFRFFTRFAVAGSVPLAVAPSIVPLKIRVKAPSPDAGDFQFLFSVTQRSASTLQVSLDEIDCFEDSSGGTTRWRFSVVLDSSSGFEIPERRYGDAGHPQKYATAAADRTRFSLSVSPAKGGQNIRVVGYKPKHVE